MYEKQTWVSGEIVTEGKLNHMEEGIATGGGIYSAGNTVYYDGEVTTEAQDAGNVGNINFDKLLPEKEIQVTFNGQEYALPITKDPIGNIIGWGELDDNYQPVLSNYPVYIFYRESLDTNVDVYTAEAGTYSLKIEAYMMSVSDDFSDSLKDSLSMPKITVIGVTESLDGTTLNMNFAEINEHYMRGEILFAENELVLGIKEGNVFEVFVLSLTTTGTISIDRYMTDSIQGYPVKQLD